MYVDGDVLSVITSHYETALYEREKNTYDTLEQETTHLYTYDISDRDQGIRQIGHCFPGGVLPVLQKIGTVCISLYQLFTVYTEDPEAVEEYIPRVNGELLSSRGTFICPGNRFIQLYCNKPQWIQKGPIK
jgi:hypothetical protein